MNSGNIFSDDTALCCVDLFAINTSNSFLFAACVHFYCLVYSITLILFMLVPLNGNRVTTLCVLKSR